MDYLTPNPDLYNVPGRTTAFNGMPYRRLSRSGLQVPNVGLGTWKFGLPETGDGSRVDEPTAYEIFDRCIELGVAMWDTANRYNAGSGNAERLIGRWLKENPDQRRNIIIATKMYVGMDGLTPNHGGLSRTNILESLYASLERMQTEYVDILYFHRFDTTGCLEESLAAIEDLVRDDLVRYFAVSNFNLQQMKMLKEVQERLSIRCHVQAVQNQFDILNGESESDRGVLDYLVQEGISLIPYSPLALGLLTEKYLDKSSVGEGDRLYDEGKLETLATEEKMKIVRKLADVAHESGLKLNELTIAYMLTLPGMGTVIPSCSNVEQLESNARGGTVSLTEEQINKVKTVLAGT